MFGKYDIYEQPNNLNSKEVTDTAKVFLKTPVIERDAVGNITQFTWVEGDTFQFTFPSYILVTIPIDSLVLTQKGLEPSSSQSSYTFAYNTVDSRCWKFDVGIWKELDYLHCDLRSTWAISVPLGSHDFRIQIVDFRGDVIHEQNSLLFDISTIQDKIAQGTYTLKVFGQNDSNNETSYSVTISCLGKDSILQDKKVNELNNSAEYADIGKLVVDHSLKEEEFELPEDIHMLSGWVWKKYLDGTFELRTTLELWMGSEYENYFYAPFDMYNIHHVVESISNVNSDYVYHIDLSIVSLGDNPRGHNARDITVYGHIDPALYEEFVETLPEWEEPDLGGSFDIIITGRWHK